jgi:peptidyl-prolyl cis-trans isomerase D
MLQALREKTSGLIAKIILGLIIIAFSFFGIESYFQARTDEFVARVGDKEISQAEFRARVDEQRQRLMQQTNGQIDGRYFEQPEIKRQILDQMVDEQVLMVANEKLGVVIPAQALRDEILQVEAFKRDGNFDEAQYRALLSSQGMTPRTFEERLAKQLSSREMPVQIANSVFVTDAEIDAYLRLRDQVRDFSFVKLAKPELSETEVSDDELSAYYTEHQQEFMNPEEVAIEYIEFDAAKLDINMTPDESTLKDRYEKEKSRFVSTEQRLASHILIKVGGKGGPEDQKQALEKAQKIAEDARAGKSFADLAKQSSDDLGSKALGGDLGWVDKDMTDPAFEAALYALEKGKVSDPVLSSEGYHVIELRDVRPGETRTFEEVRDELVKEYTESERERVYNERSGRLIDLTYQDSSSLAPAANELGLKVEKTGLFTRQGGEGLAANPAIISAAFSDTVLVQGNNSEAVELGPNHIAVLRISEHKAATPKPIDEVRSEIRDSIIAGRIGKQAKARADELYARIEKGESLDAIAAEANSEVKSEKGVGRNALNVDQAIVAATFEMARPQSEKPSTKLVPLMNDEFALVRLDAVTDADPSTLDATTRDAARTSLRESASTEAVIEFVKALRSSLKINIREDRM